MEISTIKQFILIYIMASILSEMSGHYNRRYRGRPWRRPWHRPGSHQSQDRSTQSQDRSTQSQDRSTQSQDRSSLGSTTMPANKAQKVCNAIKDIRKRTFLSCCPQCTEVSFSCEEGFYLRGKTHFSTEGKSLDDLIKLIPQCIDIRECRHNPCENNGVCENSEGSYSCNCTGTGYTGFNCQVEDTPVTKVDDIFFDAKRERCDECLHPCRCTCVRRIKEAVVILPAPTSPAATEPIVAECKDPLDLVFLFDSNLSIDDAEYELEKQFVIDVTYWFKIGMNETRVALVQSSGTLEWNLNDTQSNSHEDLTLAIMGLEQQCCGSNIIRGMKVAREEVRSSQGDRPDVPNVVVVLAEGPSFNPLSDLEIPRNVPRRPQLFAVGMTNNVSLAEMAAIASGPHMTNVFTVDRFQDLDDIVYPLVKGICPRVTPEPTVVPEPEPVPKEVEEQCICCCPRSEKESCPDVQCPDVQRTESDGK